MRGHVGRAPRAQAEAYTPLLGEQGGPISSRPRAGAACADGRAPSPWESRALERAEHAALEAWRLARRLRRSSIDGAGAHSAVPGPLARAGSIAWSTCGARGGARAVSMGAERCAGAGAEGWGRGAAHRARRARPSDAVVVEERRPSPTSRRGRATTPLTPAAAHARSTRPAESGRRPSWSSGDRRPQSSGRNRAAALQLPATSRYWAPWRPSSRARTARGRATAQHDVKGVGRCNSQRAQQREYREQHGHHPAPSASALRRGGARQPDIGSRSLAVQPGSWVGPLGADCGEHAPLCTFGPTHLHRHLHRFGGEDGGEGELPKIRDLAFVLASPPRRCGQRQAPRVRGASSDDGDPVPDRGYFRDSKLVRSYHGCGER